MIGVLLKDWQCDHGAISPYLMVLFSWGHADDGDDMFMFMLIMMMNSLFAEQWKKADKKMNIWNTKCRSCQQGLVRCAQVLFFLYSPRRNCTEPMLFRFLALHLKGGFWLFVFYFECFKMLGKSWHSNLFWSPTCGQSPPISASSLPQSVL